MKKSFLTAFLVGVIVLNSFGWGLTGHRVVGEIASYHLSKKAAKSIEELLGPESLAMVANWMDEIKSDPSYNRLNSWHYLTVKTGQSYDPSIQEKSGDAYGKTKMIIAALKNGEIDREEKKAYLKMLVHLVGDLHQPLHVGTGDDRGGNDAKVTYFNQNTNLHTVWDSKIIDGKNLSYTELSQHLNRRATKSLILEYQNNPMEDWLQEAVDLRPIIYDLPDNKRLSYSYGYHTYPIIETRLLAGGIRLAGILNDIFK
ncbi:S1/P1 nuclease [Cyclobacterium qasimii]|uniref:S1/P1 endonuclease family protein n=2 Tax=Cyclobacterium qasimii TaxID=1350429 RepID=S7VA53_9BACT|nr:S1/P1 nuclease [Cyclobacterium qasimii]EPR66462.1 S1/P1 endonuclease family protein [Cyclobacterium qasimii M12-11B]GEO21095.1 endonuclease [Cyclobacterium qasimii]